MNYKEKREERKKIKQKLFFIRRYIEGEKLKLDKDLKDLKNLFENLPGFTCWSDFPEKWDIGDPHGIKSNSYVYSDNDKLNIELIKGKPYEFIVPLEQKTKSQQEIQALSLLREKTLREINNLEQEGIN